MSKTYVQGFRVKEGPSCVVFCAVATRENTHLSPSLTLKPYTACGHRNAHRKRKETKLQPDTAGPGNRLCSCLVSFHFLWAILCPQAVLSFFNVVRRFFFNPDTGDCEPFGYGGCEGNENNFVSLLQCSETCVRDPTKRDAIREEVCSQPKYKHETAPLLKSRCKDEFKYSNNSSIF